MSDLITRNKLLDTSKQKYQAYLEKGDIRMANAIIRDASFNCDMLGKNVIAEFYHLVCDTATEVRELKDLVQKNVIKCPNCDFVAMSKQSLNSHRGKKHKV